MGRRYAARTDANQAEIVDALRKAGVSVQPLHAVGGGVPDLLCGYRNANFLIEAKDENKPPSQRKLNEVQVEWHRAWNGQVVTVTNINEALAAIGIEHRGTVG